MINLKCLFGCAYQPLVTPLKEQLTQSNANYEAKVTELNAIQTELIRAEAKIEELNKILNKDKNKWETYYESKYSQTPVTYRRKEIDKEYQIDVRNFVSMLKDEKIPVVDGINDDEKALNGLKWVIRNIVYTEDKKSYGFDEYWAFPYQTIERKIGDCEDGSLLLYCILIKSGVPYWKVRVHAGDTPYGGHAYLVYFCEETEKFVTLDWCYFPNQIVIKERPSYKSDQLYGNAWFSFNHLYSYSDGVKTEIVANDILKSGDK